MDWYEKAKSVSNREEFLSFLINLVHDFKTNQKEWENDSIETYLAGMHGFVHDLKPEADNHLTWSDVAAMLVAASVYE